MSRTLKDRPHDIKFPDSLNMSWPYYDIPSGTIPKKKRYAKPDWTHWHATPGWWIHLCMTKRRRAENRIYEATIKQVPLDLIENYEPFLNWKRPHIYYW